MVCKVHQSAAYHRRLRVRTVLSLTSCLGVSLGVSLLVSRCCIPLSTPSAYCFSERVSQDMSLECLSRRVSFGVGVLHTIVDSEFGVSCLSGRVSDVSFVSFLVCKC